MAVTLRLMNQQPLDQTLHSPAIDEGMRDDYEGCFSVLDMAGKVPRYKCIEVQALDRNGEAVSRTIRGYLARIIQHEVDHLDGVLFVDKVDEMSVMGMDEYRAMRMKAEQSQQTE